jgi:hypothetical protein
MKCFIGCSFVDDAGDNGLGSTLFVFTTAIWRWHERLRKYGQK